MDAALGQASLWPCGLKGRERGTRTPVPVAQHQPAPPYLGTLP